MEYCKDHTNKAYTEKEFGKVETCKHSGAYQGADDGKIRVYCFIKLDKGVCPLEKQER